MRDAVSEEVLRQKGNRGKWQLGAYLENKQRDEYPTHSGPHISYVIQKDGFNLKVRMREGLNDIFHPLIHSKWL